MIKLLIAGRAAPGQTREAAHRHLRDVHGPLVYDAPPDAGQMPLRYVQNHVFEGPTLPALARYRGDRDLVTEIWFDDFAQLARATTTPYYRGVLQPDELRFVDEATVLKGAMREGTLRGRAPRHPAKALVFLKRESGHTPEFEALCERALGEVAAAASAYLLNSALPAPGGREPYADQMGEFWFETRDQATGFCETVLSVVFARLAESLDLKSSFFVLADEYDVARLRASRTLAA